MKTLFKIREATTIKLQDATFPAPQASAVGRTGPLLWAGPQGQAPTTSSGTESWVHTTTKTRPLSPRAEETFWGVSQEFRKFNYLPQIFTFSSQIYLQFLFQGLPLIFALSKKSSEIYLFLVFISQKNNLNLENGHLLTMMSSSATLLLISLLFSFHSTFYF